MYVIAIFFDWNELIELNVERMLWYVWIAELNKIIGELNSSGKTNFGSNDLEIGLHKYLLIGLMAQNFAQFLLTIII